MIERYRIAGIVLLFKKVIQGLIVDVVPVDFCVFTTDAARFK